MCDTLTSATSLMPNFLSFGKYICSTDKTEPDNGHKSDTTSIAKLDYKLESERLKTFKNWKCSAVRAEDLAKAGFYCLNHPTRSDLVKCAFCHAEICNWESGDDALLEHIRWSPNCPFAKEKCSSGSKATLSFLRSAASGQDVCGNAEILSNSVPESETFRLLSSMVRHYDDPKVRLESFANWPQSSKQKPATMAEAGFYYRGVADHAICFSCGGALRDWKDEDDPWEQHALWFPHCKYLVANKDSEYIKEVQNKFNSVTTPISTKEPEEYKRACERSSNTSSSDDFLACKICESNDREIMFIPCKHVLACGECSRRLNKCPVCRQPIEQKMEVFLA